MKKVEFKASPSKVSQMTILAPIGAVAGMTYIYISTGQLSAIEVIPLAVVAFAFAWLGNRLKSTPYFEVENSQLTVNNVFTGKRTNIPFAEIEQASIAMNTLKIKRKGESRPLQVAIGMLSAEDKEEVKKIFLPMSS